MVKLPDKATDVFTRLATTKKAFELSPDEAFLCSSCIALIMRTDESPAEKVKAAQDMYSIMGDDAVNDLLNRLDDHLKESVEAGQGLDNA